MNGEAAQQRPPIEVKVLELSQPLGLFYVGVMSACDLRLIAYADTRRQTQREIELYSGIQRELSKTRQTEIKEYISTFDACFPNSFIVSVKESDILERTDGLLKIRPAEHVARIIDGQHRLAGFDEINCRDFQLVVSIFVELPVEAQAMLFATINLKQTKVNPSLVYDLFEETRLRSPQKTCHNIARSLNMEADSPFYHRIKPLGKRTEEYTGLITQATFVKSLVPYIAAEPDHVRDQIKRGVKLNVDDPDNSACMFWKYFVEDKDWAILKVITNYYSAVREVFPEDWDSTESPLPRTIGFSALMRLLEPLYRAGAKIGSLEKSFFAERLEKGKQLAPFTFDKYPASGVGENKLYETLRQTVL